MEEEIGTVVSTLQSPSPAAVDFVVSKGAIHRGQLVEMDYSEGTLIALVTNVVKTNRYFERAESVKEFEAKGSALFEQFPTVEWEYLVANTKPLGVFKGSATKRATFPPSPGTKVRIASPENLKRFFKFDEKTGLHLGTLEFHNLPVNINLTKLLQKHLAILAMSGSGKCIKPDSGLLLSDGRVEKIGALVDKHLQKSKIVEEGVEIHLFNSSKLKVVSLADNNQLVSSEIKAFMRRKAPEKMVRIKTQTGKELEFGPLVLVEC